MKQALIIIFFVINTIASATDYYISSSGNDANNGLSPSTPWKTIAKVNSAFSIMKPGDRILFKRGDVFTGQITLTRSGSSIAKITFSAYGIGDVPVIEGNTDINSWTRFNGNIWVADCPQLGSTVTNFLINGKSQQIGRYPNADVTNKGYLTIKSHVGNTQLTCASLASSPNWTGAEAVVRSARWVLDRVPIQSHQGNVLVFSKPTSYEIQDNFGFFIQNNLNTLDQPGEWYFDSANKKMYLYWSSDPNSLNTQTSAYSSTFIANGQNYFSIGNIQFRGSVNTVVSINNSANIDINYTTISEAGTNAVYFGACNNVSFNYNKIINTNNNALIFELCENVVAHNNEIRRTAIRSGMGLSSNGQYTGLSMSGNNNNFESNIIDSVGYIGINFSGNLVTIKNNFISNFCMTKDDGGGLYTWSDGKTVNHDCGLENNIILNGIGAKEGTDNMARNGAEGIYMDITSAGVSITDNTVTNCNTGIFIYNANHISITGNTLYNNNKQLEFAHSDQPPISPITNCSVNNNIFFAKSNIQLVADFSTIDNGIPNFGSFDNNYYCRPMDDNLTFYTKYIGPSGSVSKYMNLETWQTTYQYDLHSKKSPITISSTVNIDDFIKFIYNATSSIITYNLGGNFIDVKGDKYSSYSLQPFTSAVLMVDPDPSAPPVTPVYVSSVIENATPNILEMTYSLNLTNIVPAVSAFNVQVNSVSRAINSIAIVGGKVRLTLASRVVYGDNITVTYSKPANNPLQTISAAQAASITLQPVINNCININPVVIIISPGNGSSFTASANITITANASDADGNISKVEFYSASTKLGEKATAPFSYTWNNVAVGTYILTAVATDNFNAKTTSSAISISVTNGVPPVNNPPTVSIVSPVENSSFTAPTNITITANASDVDGTISKVEFYNGSTKLGSKSAAPYSFTWNNVAVGTYILTAIATDNLNAKTTSSVVSISVNIGTPIVNQPPIVTISNPSKGNKYENISTITIDAIASDPDGTVVKVEFYNGSEKLVELTSPPYSYTWKDVRAGTYSITAIATDNLNATTTSLPIEFEVTTDSEILNLYPNPNDGHFSIEFVNPLQNEKSKVVITDLAGKQVYNGILLKDETIKQIDLSYIKSGIYILMIIYKEVLVTKKLIKY